MLNFDNTLTEVKIGLIELMIVLDPWNFFHISLVLKAARPVLIHT